MENIELDASTLVAQMPLRHSVRSFTSQPIEEEVRDALSAFAEECNRASGLSLQLITDEPDAFSGMMARYGSFQNVRNYLACVGPKSATVQEDVGYWGEHCVLAAQALGLNSCWVALTYSKRKTQAQVRNDQKLVCVIALGHGTTPGKPRPSKDAAQVSSAPADAPAWFRRGIEAALLAPTAMNQQKFMLEYRNGKVALTSTGGPYADIDLGIVKAHFELGAGQGTGIWI